MCVDGDGDGEGGGLEPVRQEGELRHLRAGPEDRLQAGRHRQQRQHIANSEFMETGVKDVQENTVIRIRQKA